MEIRYTEIKDLELQLSGVCAKISTIYSINHPSNDFITHLCFTLKKHYGYLSIEQVESAFEYNSLGSLNDFLPKSGHSIDNKVKFNIPDILKVVKAYSRCKGLDAPVQKPTNEPNVDSKNMITQEWCNHLEAIFELYANKNIKTPITLPLYTAEILAKLGLIDQKQIDYKERSIRIKFKGQTLNSSNNEALIYKAFTNILERGEDFGMHLKEHRERFLSIYEMPNF